MVFSYHLLNLLLTAAVVAQIELPMVGASEIVFVAVFLASDKAWAVSGELVAASGGAGRSVFF